jgi:hypothetical protein
VAGAAGYLIDERINGAWSQIVNFGSNATGATVNGLKPSTTYTFDVAAYNTDGTSWANPQSATTSTILTPPSAPSFTAKVVSGTQINLSWGAVAGATGYLIDERINGAWSQIASGGSGATGATVSGLAPGTTYTFDVAAYNAAGTSWANSQSATTTSAVVVDHPAAATAYVPVSGSLFGPNGPSFLDVQQGPGLGDCWLLSGLAEVAARDPVAIRNMFTAAGTTVENGSVVNLYSVRFFNRTGAAKYVTVDTELPSGGDYYDTPVNGVLWAALAEKAYAEANGGGIVTSQSEGRDSYDALNGGNSVWALQAITGKASSYAGLNPAIIASAMQMGELVDIGATNPASSFIVPNHFCAVVDYNPSSSTPFELFNPWGGTTSSVWCPQDKQVYGLFWANASFLAQNFTDQSFGSAASVATDATAASLSQYFAEMADHTKDCQKTTDR